MCGDRLRYRAHVTVGKWVSTSAEPSAVRTGHRGDSVNVYPFIRKDPSGASLVPPLRVYLAALPGGDDGVPLSARTAPQIV